MANLPLTAIEILKKKVSPAFRAGRMGSNPGELLAPKGIAVDPQSDHILVADEGNNRVQVFNPKGTYLYKFGRDSSLPMRMPYGVKILGGLVFVTQYSLNRVDVYTVEGDLVTSSGDSAMFWPTGVEVIGYPEGGMCMFLCSSARSSLLIRSDERNEEITGTGGPQGRFIQPKDVKVCRDQLFVLDLRDPCLHLFSLGGEFERSFISNGIGRDVAGPLFFCVDAEGLIVIGDNQCNRVKAFSVSSGELLHEIGVHPGGGGGERFVRSSSLMSHLVHSGLSSFSANGLVRCPRGVALNSKLQLVVVGLTNEGSVQIF